MFDFEIDEHAMRINHYFKRKQAIFSKLCLFVLLPVSIMRALNILFISNDNDLVAWIDYLAIRNIILTAFLFALTKAITQACQALCPLKLASFKKLINVNYYQKGKLEKGQ